MKKTLLLLSFVTVMGAYAIEPSMQLRDGLFDHNKGTFEPMVAKSQMKADASSMAFGYSDEPYDVNRFGNEEKGCYIYQAFELSVEDQKKLKGAKITAVNFFNGTTSDQSANCMGKVYAFVSDSRNKIPENATMKQMGQENPLSFTSITLDNPVTITAEKPLYIGFYFKYVKDGYYIVYDGVPTNDNTCLIAIAKDEQTAPYFDNYAENVGSLCMTATVEGTNLPKNWIVPVGISLSNYYSPASKISYSLRIKNRGVNNVTSIKVHSQVEDFTSVDKTVKVTNGVANNAYATVNVTGVPNTELGVYTLNSSIVSVNGESVSEPTTISGIYASYDNGYPRRIVVEEATGTWCGWCPRGIVMMEYLKENYPDWIRIAVHGGDEMEAKSYGSYLNDYVSGFPSAMVNRIKSLEVAGDDDSYYAPVNSLFTSYPSYGKIELKAECPESRYVEVEATTEFSLNLKGNHQLAFVVVEDGVGPYTQTNYYSGNAAGACGGWESKESTVAGVMYDDVARYLDGYPGIKGSLPDEIESFKSYTYSRVVPVTDLQGFGDFHLIGLIVNTFTGEIVNAAEVMVERPSGIEDVNIDMNDIYVSNGSILSSSPIEVYTLDGRRVHHENLAKGIYMVVANGKSKKIMVK